MKNEINPEIAAVRKFEYPIHPILANRWSSRAMSGEKISDKELMCLFEAARWAPSSYNGQPWRFIYAHRETPEWKYLFDLLIEFNQGWCKNAAVLLLMISRKNFEHNNKAERTHSFDTGSAWMSLTVEGSARDLVVHGMEGFDFDRAYTALGIPSDYTVEAMAAIGKKASKAILSKELQEREVPGTRKPLPSLIMLGKFDPAKK